MYNTSACVLGVLIARASGQPLETFFRERIFEPLGMHDTSFSVPANKLDRLPDSYIDMTNSGTLSLYDAASDSQWSRPPAFPDGGAGLVSTIDDYLAFNPTRNRDLDMLPLLLHLDGARVRAALPNEKINGRPAFHYRLPDARVSDPGWSVAPDWNRWVAVERLASDRERLESVGLAFLAFEGEEKSWGDTVERIAF